MKKLIALICILIITACNTQKKYTDFDISYVRSGGYAPIYENLLIKGNAVHYSFEGQGKKIKKDFKITDAEKKKLSEILRVNKFRSIQEDFKKRYDQIFTSINIKNGEIAGSKSDASGIMQKDQKKWDNIIEYFQKYITANTGNLKNK